MGVAVLSIQDVSVSEDAEGNLALTARTLDIHFGASHIRSRFRDRQPEHPLLVEIGEPAAISTVPEL